jgi:hypothetical protein
VRISLLLMALAWFWQEPPTVRELSHRSQVLDSNRTYRAILPASYAASQKRYPVIYWLYGYEQAGEDREREIAAYTTAHDVIVIAAGPFETTGEFPMYFPELVQNVDATLRTIANRDHRGVAGVALGGFMALWTAGKFPDLVSSASSMDAYAEAPVGPVGFPAECGADDGAFNYDSVRTLPAAESTAKMLEFHSAVFAKPLPKPAAFSHADVYPNFTIWGWEASSNRRQPGFTLLENVSAKGFRSAVREWVPGGATLDGIKLTLLSAPLYPPASTQSIVYIHLRDGKVRRANQKADSQGRLTFELDGDAYEVGVSAEPLLAASGYEIAGAGWATAGKPVELRVKFWNKGGAKSGTTLVKWESPDDGVRFAAATTRLFGLAPGESATAPVTFTVDDTHRSSVRVVAVEGASRTPLDVPVFPPAEPAKVFQLADGTTVDAWQHGTQHGEVTLGEGNRDNHAAPGESFAVLLPDGEYLRRAEVFTNDPCVDNTVRASDALGEHASAKYSLPSIRPDCQPGHVVHMLSRIVMPGGPARYWTIEFPVWYRTEAR